MRTFQSHGSGEFTNDQFKKIGSPVIFEKGVRVFHPEHITLGNNVYVGHNTFLKAYHKNELLIGNNVWIGQNVFIHAAGGIDIGNEVGIGPNVCFLTSAHQILGKTKIILDSPIDFKKITIEQGVDIGAGSILLPGITLGQGAQIGAGSVVTKDVAPFSVVAGNPAKLLRMRS